MTNSTAGSGVPGQSPVIVTRMVATCASGRAPIHEVRSAGSRRAASVSRLPQTSRVVGIQQAGAVPLHRQSGRVAGDLIDVVARALDHAENQRRLLRHRVPCVN